MLHRAGVTVRRVVWPSLRCIGALQPMPSRPRFAAVALLRGLGNPTLKFCALLFVSVEPQPLRKSAVTIEGAGALFAAAKAEPPVLGSFQVVPVP